MKRSRFTEEQTIGILREQKAGVSVAALDAIEASDWGRKYPAIAQSWRRARAEVIQFYGFAEEVRRIVYTTIVHLRLKIEKLRPELYGQRSERKQRLLEEMGRQKNVVPRRSQRQSARHRHPPLDKD